MDLIPWKNNATLLSTAVPANGHSGLGPILEATSYFVLSNLRICCIEVYFFAYKIYLQIITKIVSIFVEFAGNFHFHREHLDGKL